MKIIRSLNIKRETRQVFTFKTRAETIYALCSHCGIEKRMISAVISARILNISERKIFALVENETFHLFETKIGKLYLCAESVNEFAERNSKDRVCKKLK